MSAMSRTVNFFMLSPLAVSRVKYLNWKEAKHQGWVINLTSITLASFMLYTNHEKKLIKLSLMMKSSPTYFLGGATTLVSIVSRLVIYHISHQESNCPSLILSVLFLPLSQMIQSSLNKEKNWPIRLVRIFLSPSLYSWSGPSWTYIFVTSYPNIMDNLSSRI